MDEEMVALDVNVAWELVALPEESNWVQMGVQSQTQCRWICEQIQSKIGCQRLCPNVWHRL